MSTKTLNSILQKAAAYSVTKDITFDVIMEELYGSYQIRAYRRSDDTIMRTRISHYQLMDKEKLIEKVCKFVADVDEKFELFDSPLMKALR